MSKFVKLNGVRQTKFDLAQLLMRSGCRWYVNPDYFTYSELLDICIKKGMKFDN